MDSKHLDTLHLAFSICCNGAIFVLRCFGLGHADSLTLKSPPQRIPILVRSFVQIVYFLLLRKHITATASFQQHIDVLCDGAVLRHAHEQYKNTLLKHFTVKSSQEWSIIFIWSQLKLWSAILFVTTAAFRGSARTTSYERFGVHILKQVPTFTQQERARVSVSIGAKYESDIVCVTNN
ncbi:Hypothetical_protein [Hexamita inflata]|uniref:Hypothetical_protein n=1 Tax=Hexamita inflata TaxID=28002 RepID=A0AA86QCB0_9EUKA|nr:Hypothetical protein HINF_LOCUS41157 [Hexamita inflata]